MADLEMVRGDTTIYDVVATATDAAGATAAINLTGKTLTFTARRERGSKNDLTNPAVISLSVGNGITPDPDQAANTGRGVVTIPPAATTGLPDYRVCLFWDLELIDGENVYTLSSGTLTVIPDSA